MKRTLLCLLAAFVFAAGGAPAAEPNGTELTVSGTGSVSLPPNVAIVSAAIETNAANANDAIAQSNAIYDRVVASMAKLGVARGDVALSYYNVNYNPRPRAVSAGSEERYGYTVSRGFTVKVREIGKAGTVSDACTAAGATAINGVSFGLADESAARAQATARAVADARSNAQALAQAAGLRIVSMKSIELGGGPSGPVPMMRVAATANAAPTQFDQSNVNVVVSVSVVFVAQP